MDKFEVKTGAVAIEVLGITNYSELQNVLGEKVANVPICTKENKKELTETVSHYKKIRTPLKKSRAEANKMLKAKSKEILSEYDTAIDLVSGYIEPFEQEINEYDEKVKRFKLNKIKEETAERLQELNNYIEDMNSNFEHLIIECLEFDEAWAKNTKAAFEFIQSYKQNAENTYNRIKNNTFAIEMICKKLKNEYDLQSDLNYKLILSDKLYTEDLQVLENTLEKFAEDQQLKEIEAAEIAEKEAIRKAEEQKLKEPEAAQEKARQEERERIEKERLEEEEIKRQIAENDRKLKERANTTAKKLRLEFVIDTDDELTEIEDNIYQAIINFYDINTDKFKLSEVE